MSDMFDFTKLDQGPLKSRAAPSPALPPGAFTSPPAAHRRRQVVPMNGLAGARTIS